MTFKFYYVQEFNENDFFNNQSNLTLKDSQGRTALSQAADAYHFDIVEKILEQYPGETSEDEKEDIYGHIPTFNRLLYYIYSQRHYINDVRKEKALNCLKTILSKNLSSFSMIYFSGVCISPFQAVLAINDQDLIRLYVNSTVIFPAKDKYISQEPYSKLSAISDKQLIKDIISSCPATTTEQKNAASSFLGHLLSGYDPRDNDLIILLISQGSFLRCKVKNYDTPLHWAIDNKHEALIKAMISSPHCPWGMTSTYQNKRQLKPFELAEQLATPAEGNIILNLIENKPEFLGALLNTNKNKATQTFKSILFATLPNEDLDHDFYKELIHRLTQVTPLHETNKSTIKKLLQDHKFSIDQLSKDVTPLQAIMNMYKVPPLDTLEFLKEAGANMLVTNAEGFTLPHQILVSDTKLEQGMKTFLYSLAGQYPELTETNGASIYTLLASRPGVFLENVLCAFGIQARAYFQGILDIDSPQEYKPKFFTELLLGIDSNKELKEFENVEKFRDAALNALQSVVEDNKTLSSDADLQKNPVIRLLNETLKEPLFKTHGRYKKAVVKFLGNETKPSAISAIEKMIEKCPVKTLTNYHI